ncbi:amino acid ABC transporter substrate-binding protein [Thermoclostridium stercorarium subsp. thermolacticum DSM 2910]|uniref:Amino acid ABC transporter substrate-binding protein n=1 Tax=Thermoclostridium stercorarium subsp. thermolacticum DSM 2910 TaxID=1121336 RepID=A0A1B1YEH8_THEST|nr:transporter substrate-binding domain-containing protein [Thermoclostridium stercorarium]ANW99150.1 amino acid ABC transporter substrate-binding protein [Thermoclostridium stercorarium subsp. thermolacticum DSM 2910]UZQ84838.1 transporter substrate-binding domain-containing protein [Thermoclostridium stercorarium]
MSFKHRIAVLLLLLAVIATAAACAKSTTVSPDSSIDSSKSEIFGSTDSSAEIKEIRVAHTQTFVPYDFVNDQGESDGFEVQVLKAVDELLPQYKFIFVPTSDDDLLIGVESGKYNIGVKGAWFTEERAKKYIFPKNYISASIIGLTIRAEDADKITDMESFAKYSGKLVPIAPQNAQWAIVEEYNRTHPDNQVNLVASEVFNISDAYTWVLEGRYDAYFDIKLSFYNNVLAENAPYRDFADKLAYVPYRAIPTYPLFNKNDQALADAYDEAVEQLRKDGVISELSQKYFGEDIFKYIDK